MWSDKTFLNISENVCKLQVKLLDTVTSIKMVVPFFFQKKKTINTENINVKNIFWQIRAVE